METVAHHNFFCFIFKPPGQVFNLVTVPLPTTVWWRTNTVLFIYISEKRSIRLFKESQSIAAVCAVGFKGVV